MAISVIKFEQKIREKAGKFFNVDEKHGSGTLEAREIKAGTQFYFRYTGSNGQRDRLPLGFYCVKGVNGLSLSEAFSKAAELRKRIETGERDLRAADQRARDAIKRADDALKAEEAHRRAEAALEAQALEHARKANLGALLTAYTARLYRDKKFSAKKVEACLFHHVRDAMPELWTKPLTQVTPECLLEPVARLAEASKLREASRLRSYIRAAYAAGQAAGTDPQSSQAMRALKIRNNPAQALGTVKGANHARERALSIAELRAYWQRIIQLPSPTGPLLVAHLLLGGQRCEQLARVTTAQLDTDEALLTLLDSKGRRTTPRSHYVPILPEAMRALKSLTAVRMGDFVFTINSGESGAAHSSVAVRVRQVSQAMHDAGELENGPFTVGDLRRTVETSLQAAGVSDATLAHLMSHGLGGVQKRHYQKHDFKYEKRAALQKLLELVTRASAKVLPIQKTQTAHDDLCGAARFFQGAPKLFE